MVRTSRRQTLLRTTLPAVEHVEPSEETAFDFSSQPADEADQQTAEADRVQEAEQRIDADRLLPVLIQEMNLPQEAKDHLYQEIQRVRQCPHPSPPQTRAELRSGHNPQGGAKRTELFPLRQG